MGIPNWLYGDTGTTNPGQLAIWSATHQQGAWKDFIWRMTERTGKTTLKYNWSAIFSGMGLTGKLAEAGKITVNLSNRGYDTPADIAFKGCFWIALYPAEAQNEIFRMSMGWSHGIEGEDTHQRTRANIDPHDPNLQNAFALKYGNARGYDTDSVDSLSGGAVDPEKFKDAYLSTLNRSRGAIYTVGDMPAGGDRFNSIYDRSMRGPGRQAHYGDPSLIPAKFDPVTLTIVLASIAAVAAIVYWVLDYLETMQTTAMTFEHTEAMADKGYDVEVTARDKTMGIQTDGSGIMLGSSNTGLSLKSSRSSAKGAGNTRATTNNNKASGSRGSNIYSVNATNMINMRSQTGDLPIEDKTEDTTPKPADPIVPIGIGALAYFLI